jgi:hypothetical protein
MTQLAAALDGRLRISQRGVPHILVEYGGTTYSLAYFSRTDTYRAFFPWPSRGPQERTDFASRAAVLDFFHTRCRRACPPGRCCAGWSCRRIRVRPGWNGCWRPWASA